MLEKILDQILHEIQSLKEGQQNIEIQLNENTQIIKALIHRTEELDAKFDGLLHNTATKEALDKLATKDDINAQFEVLNSRLFQNEVEVQRLKAIK